MAGHANDAWLPCPNGELERLSHRLGRAKRRERGIGLTLGTALTAAFGVIALAVVDWSHAERSSRSTAVVRSVIPIGQDCRPAPEGGCDSKR